VELRSLLDEHRHVTRNEDDSGVWASPQAGDLVGVFAPVGEAVERIGDEAKTIEVRQRRPAGRPLKDNAP
jgi:hypothetical protein